MKITRFIFHVWNFLQKYDFSKKEVAVFNGVCQPALQGQEAYIHIQDLCTSLKTNHRLLEPILTVLEPSFTFLLILSFVDQTQINWVWILSALRGIPMKSLAQVSNGSSHYLERCKEVKLLRGGLHHPSLNFSVERTRFTNAMIRQSCLLKITLVGFSARITHFGPKNIGLIFGPFLICSEVPVLF